MENKQMAPKENKNFDLDLIDSCTDNVVSGTECTGLIPTPPEDEPESESYTELYTIPKPASIREVHRRRQEHKNKS
ncbi:MAG: hypothetical protein ACFWUD_09385 [Thermocaproicibacter melissae]|uniref:hypothetical protein n=1 Tax=Thermocaproicibacter melissae TaxID=2966552 RepID=UPI0024B0CED9|nr:hypothetical protein [Thermocaproicibacter melissae]WBY64872.1 hypothetical protein NOG13_04050 [Thermocaproicibacter melissae]